MPLSPGQTVGPYEILAPLGAGGMGTVYRARDPRVGREVAIKVSHEQFSERFEREARAVAALNHPHICQLYDVGPNYLVMEYIEGAPLQGPLPLAQALRYADQVAGALQHAHSKGIVHRDLKPANILVTKQGIKLLDFGLAKFQKVVGVAEETLTKALTAHGTLLGTLHYMSPEQLEGKDADERSDIFSFGCVLYELIAGKRAFEGTSGASLIATILQKEPAPLEPQAVNRVVETCLAKDPEERWQTIRELRHALRWNVQEQPPPAVAGSVKRSRLPWAVAALATLLAIVLASLWLTRPATVIQASQFAVEPPPGAGFNFLITAVAISPDGRYLVFRAASGGGTPSLWLRPLDSLAARVLPGTDGADFPFWSPDSKSIGFFAADKLKRLDIAGGTPQVLCDGDGGPSAAAQGGTWNRDGVILFGDRRGLFRVPASGGTAALLIKTDSSRLEAGYGHPQFLPGGKSFLYFVQSNDANTQGVYAASLDRPQDRIPVLRTPAKAIYAAPMPGQPGRLLFLRERTLLAQPFDAHKLRLEGDPTPLADDIAVLASLRAASFWVSDTGLLIYRNGMALERVKLTWINREGIKLGDAREADAYTSLRLSPDGKRVVLGRRDTAGPGDIWVLELARSVITRFTLDPQEDTCPVWSPDGRQIAFVSDRSGVRQIYLENSGGSERAEQLTNSPRGKCAMDWSRDGRHLLYTEFGARTFELWALPLQGGRKPMVIVQAPYDASDGQFSPDGKWVAYTSNESGRNEVYVKGFSDSDIGAEGRWQVSNQGGHAPRWRGDGRELFYLSIDNRKLMAAGIRKAAPGVETETPRELFPASVPADPGYGGYPYDVTADGKRFLIEEATTSQSAPLTVVVNWQAKLRSN